MTGMGRAVYLYLKGLWQESGGAMEPMAEPIEGSETSAIRTKTQGNYPKENILHIEHCESLKSRKNLDSEASMGPEETISTPRHVLFLLTSSAKRNYFRIESKGELQQSQE